jgi:hypothetical protein
VARKLAVVLFPEGDEAENLFRLFAFAKISVGVTEGSTVGILGQEDENAGLAAASGRNVVALDGGRFARAYC